LLSTHLNKLIYMSQTFCLWCHLACLNFLSFPGGVFQCSWVTSLSEGLTDLLPDVGSLLLLGFQSLLWKPLLQKLSISTMALFLEFQSLQFCSVASSL
jgi:hypothetical protein